MTNEKRGPKNIQRGASQIEHFSVAEGGFESMQVEQIQLHPSLFAGAFIPAAPQLKPVVGFVDVLDGAGASQIEHFSVALAGLDSMHVEQVQPSPLLAAGAFTPAASQLNSLRVSFPTSEPMVNVKVDKEDVGRSFAA